MDPKQFYQRLSELTYWDFPEHGRTAKTVNTKPTTRTRQIQSQLIARWRDPLERYPQLLEGQYQPEIEEESEDEDDEDQDTLDNPKPLVHNDSESRQPNLSQAPRIIAVRHEPKQCEDCDGTYTERTVNSQLIPGAEPYWRNYCTACSHYWNTYPKNSPEVP